MGGILGLLLVLAVPAAPNAAEVCELTCASPVEDAGTARSAMRHPTHTDQSCHDVTGLSAEAVVSYESDREDGSVTVNCEPRPTPALSAATVPPCSSTRFLTIPNPNPSPVAASDSACRNGWKT